jgi:FHA domain
VIASTIAVDEALIALKIAFLVLLYLFIWRIVRAAGREVRAQAPQESMIIPPAQAAAAGLNRAAHASSARLVVVSSPALRQGDDLDVDIAPVTLGRGGQNTVPLDGDEFASATHARFEARTDGVWVEDLGSTNGTFVNGARVTTPRRLDGGDLVRVGQTELRVVL